MDLSNVVMLTGGQDGNHLLLSLLESLSHIGNGNWAEIVAKCDSVASECGKGLAERVMATQNGGYQVYRVRHMYLCANLFRYPTDKERVTKEISFCKDALDITK